MIGSIGFGNLAGSVLAGFMDKGVIAPSDITIFDKSPESRSRALELGMRVSDSIDELISCSDTVFLAVKPYVFADLLETFDVSALSGKTVISFMACYPLERLEADLQGCRIVRIIPTIAIRFGQDVIALASNCAEVGDVIELFGALGDVNHVEEAMLDKIMIGASSGLGFAAEIMSMYQRALCSMGVSAELAHKITAATFTNAARFADFDELAAKVATKGGVTEKGLAVMRGSDMASTVEKAIKTAEDFIK